jgi:anti-sigma regulatory factor (Ser/Thr protein kinase)
VSARSDGFPGVAVLSQPFDWLLAGAPTAVSTLTFDRENLRDVRAFVAARALEAGLDATRAADLVLATYEISTNSVQHGGGSGTLAIWRGDSAIVCEVRDCGQLTDPMLGRVRPSVDATSGRGLWLANQLCDLVQTRSLPTGTATRLHMRLA